MSRLVTLAVLSTLLGCAHHHEAEAHAHASHAHHETTGAAPAPEGVTPVQHEMRLLLTAVQDAMAGVAGGDVRAVPASFHRVHLAREATAAALASGAWRPAQGEVARFEALDVAFHGRLEHLVEAAARNDVGATGDALADVVRECNACHREFRPPR